MPIRNRFAELLPEITEWRQHLHRNPEILYEVHQTAAFVAEKLRAFGVDEVVEGIGQTGVVGVIRGKGAGTKTVGLRADMDALADPRGNGARLCLRGAGQDACLRP
jgi:metal-dependent amidase/aminoacylase/carboxypeptidase family protein